MTAEQAILDEIAAQLDGGAPRPDQRILVAMSGGVDSSIAAAVLASAGCSLVGVNMRTHRLTPEEKAQGARIKTCCSPVDAKDARACADALGFPFYVLDVEPAFERDVIGPFIDSYAAGRTPNPCVLCNNKVKLGALLDKARLYDCEAIATGHYARKQRHPRTGRWALRRAEDANKDQCYYLFGLAQDQLARILFPLGGLTKPEVRRRAEDAGLATAAKPESQEICFIPDNDYRRFLRGRFAARGEAMPRGKFVSVDGRVLGDHDGVAFYTVGQRRGLGIAAREPLFVVGIDPDSDTVVLGPRDALASEGLEASGINWMGWEPIREPARLRAQIRHRGEAMPGTLLPPDARGGVRFLFDEPARAVAPGQAVVFWDDDGFVAAGGWIDRALRGAEAEN